MDHGNKYKTQVCFVNVITCIVLSWNMVSAWFVYKSPLSRIDG